MKPDLEQYGARLAGQSGPRLWRSLAELAGTPEFRACLEREFPAGAAEWLEGEEERPGLGRREFLALVGASLALAGFTGCTPATREKIVPYVEQPEQIIPGKPLFYASAMPWRGHGRGILIKTEMGRPVKIEGNPAHPDSLGATDAVTQAAVLELWDPDRSQGPVLKGNLSTWDQFEAELLAVLQKAGEVQGEGMAILTEPTTSPTLRRQMGELLKKYPRARWYQGGCGLPQRQVLPPETDVGKAEVIFSIGSDFLVEEPGSLRFARQFAARRRVERGEVRPNRLYVMEATPTLTGASADERLAVPPDRAAAVLRVLGGAAEEETLSQVELVFARRLAADLKQPGAAALVLVGETEPEEIQKLAAALKPAAQAAASTFPPDELAQLTAELERGSTQQLLILGGNPVYTAPADVAFAGAMNKASFTVHLSLYQNETSLQCRWHLPEAHFMEAWSDILASDGTPTIIQPVIEPLYGGRSAHEVLSMVAADFQGTSYELVRATWQGVGAGDFEGFWEKSVHDGVVKASAPAAALGAAAAAANPGGGAPLKEVDYLLIRPDPSVGDGRWANNGWLQELPKPLTKLTWDNAVLIAPAMAERLGLNTGHVVELRAGGRTAEGPVMVLPGQADRCVTVHLGYGRSSAGHVGTNVGFKAGAMQTATARWCVPGVELRKTGRTYQLATTQDHFSMEGRNIVRVGTVEEFRANPRLMKDPGAGREEASLLPRQAPVRAVRHAWGMSVDLSTCTGCSACVVACQAENNIAVVGKDQVARGREMHWIRIDRYFEGSSHNPAMLHQPVLCMHCEKAPCEIVCPVAATVHDDEGLNTLVYNRCVGTRYCSNNCPYKVRRFNFLEYSPPEDSAEAQRQNPNVTVRRRGVMEKCTYCVQRINAGRIAAELENRAVRDGEIQTACQQACPSGAIVFGDLLDARSLVSRRKREPNDYGLLAELNTQPRTTYLGRIRNPKEVDET